MDIYTTHPPAPLWPDPTLLNGPGIFSWPDPALLNGSCAKKVGLWPDPALSEVPLTAQGDVEAKKSQNHAGERSLKG